MARKQLDNAPLLQEKMALSGLKLAEVSQFDEVWKEPWSSSLHLSDLHLMDCFVVQGKRGSNAKLHYNIHFSMFAQQVPF